MVNEADALKKAKEEYFFEVEGCYITEISNSDDDPELSIAKARVPQGITTAWHRLSNTTERYYILEGIGLVEVGQGSPYEVTVGDVVIIPVRQRQRIKNIGEQDLVFLALCTPRFEVQNYTQA